MNPNSKVVLRRRKTNNRKMLKCSVELKGTAESGDNSVCVCAFHFTHTQLSHCQQKK